MRHKLARILIGMTSVGMLAVAALPSEAQAEQLLARFQFEVIANRPYQTPLTKVTGGPVYVETVKVLVRGDYCHLYADGLHFSQVDRGPLYAAQGEGPTARYIVKSQVSALRFLFTQTRYSKVACDIELWSIDPSSPIPDPSGDLVNRATMLSTDARLFSLSTKLTHGYESLAVGSAYLSDYSTYFLDMVKANQSRARLSEVLGELKTRTKMFEKDFIAVHSQFRNQDVNNSWQAYLKSLDQISL